jgi:HAD superfamily hydrolase (TIGR01509 family)
MRIKAIAFDLANVFIKIKDIYLNPIEDSLSDVFDYKVGDQLFWNWAEEETRLGRKELEKISWETINKLYEVREPDIFEKLPKLKFATASNHLSMIKDWLKEKGMYDKFYCHVVSEDIHCMKPSSEFYEVLAKMLREKPENILLADDKEGNINGAKDFGFKTLLYDGQKLLSESILEALNEK